MLRYFLLFTCCLILLTGCNAKQVAEFGSLPEGNAERGSQIFVTRINGAPACSSCHLAIARPLVGPGLAGFSERAGQAVEGQTADEYAYTSIVHPNRHIVENFRNMMYAEYGTHLNNQQLADLIAYLLLL